MSLKIRFAHLGAMPALALLLCACQSQSVEQTQPNEPQPVAQQQSQETPQQQQPKETPMTPTEPQQNTQVAYVRMTIEGKGDLVIELDLKEAGKTLAQGTVVERCVVGKVPGDAAFGQDCGFVGVDGVERNVEMSRYFIGAHAPGEGTQHVALARAEPFPHLTTLRFVDGGNTPQLLLYCLHRCLC